MNIADKIRSGRIARIWGMLAVAMAPAPVLFAQDVTIAHDTMSAGTRGFYVTDAQQWSDSAVLFENYVVNNSNEAIVFSWQIVEKDLPFGWHIHGFCDNASCRMQNDPAITDYAVQQSMPVAAGGSSLLEPQIAVPFDGEDGTGILRVRVSYGQDADTATFLLTKSGTTGLAAVTAPGPALRLFPNPAQHSLMVGTGSRPRAGHLYGYNMAGIAVLHVVVPPGSDPYALAVGQLAPGMYFIRLADDGNRTVATGKFIKR